MIFLDRAKLNHGETLRRTSTRSSGNMGQREVECFEVVGFDGIVVGEMMFEKDTSIKKPFKTTYMLIRKSLDGLVEMKVVW